ncbi:MAG: hypothetical protein AAFQ68_07660 [Bacteroidota bacterium]
MKSILISICLLFLLSTSYAQTLRLGGQQESSSLPFTSFAELHPGFELSYGFAPTDKGTRSTQWWISGGYFHHRGLESAAYVKVSYAWQQPVGDVLQLELAPSLGYLHSFYPGNVYELRDGEYQAITQYGRPRVMAEVGFTAALWPDKAISPFVQYRFGIESPFANGIPVFPHSFYQIGISYQL